MRQEFGPGTAVAVLPGQRPTELSHQAGGVGEELTQHRGAVRPVEGEVETHVHAPVAEVPERCRGHAVGVDELVEPGQVGAELVGWDGGVLPTRPRGRVGRRPAGQAGAVLSDAPQPCLRGRVRDHGRRICDVRVRERLSARVDVLGVVAGEFDEQPRIPGRQRRNRVRTAAGTQHVEETRVQALARCRPVPDHCRRGLAGGDDVGEPEHHDRADGGVDDELDRRLGDDCQRAFGPDECLGEVEPLGEQMLRGVARHLAAEPVHLGPRRGQVPTHDGADVLDHVVGA